MESDVNKTELSSSLLGAFSKGAELALLVQEKKQVRLSVRQAANFLGVTEGSIYQRIRNQSIPYFRKAGRVFFYKNELIDWKDSLNTKEVSNG